MCGLQIYDWLLLVLALLVFVGVSLWTITKSSVWFDEAFGAYMSHFNFWEIARYTGTDVHPPLYYWLLKCWGMVFGNTELALRSMSVFFGGITIIFGYLLTNKLFNKNAARISLLFMSISPMLVRYSQEMRMYTLVAAIALAATYVLVTALESKKKLLWVVYGILVALGMWTHYFSAIVWIAHWVWRADNIRRVAGKGKFVKQFFSKQWLLANIIAVAFYAAWIPVFLAQSQIVQYFGFWIPAVTPDTLINFLTNMIYYQDVGQVNGWYALGLVGIVALLSWLAVKVYKHQDDKQKQNYRLIMAVAFVPALLLFIVSMPPLRSMFVGRYLVPSIPFIVIFAGVTLSFGAKFIKPIWRILAIVALTAFMAVGVSSVWYYGNYSKDANPPASNNARDIFNAIVAKSGDDQPIIADSPWLFYETVFYSTKQHPVYFIEANTAYLYGSLDMLKYNDQFKIKDIKQFTVDNPIVWYVGLPRGADFSAPYKDWQPVQTVEFNDSINGKPAYKAIQYKITN
jgi:uncharacterized membrane protein